MSYDVFSSFYDALTDNAEYAARAEYILKLFKKYDKRPTLLLDMACGTGSFTTEFAKAGIEVIGVDPSPEMLIKAREKLEQNGKNALFLCQTAAELDLYGTVDGAVCCLDSLNHITNYDELCDSLKRISLFLEPGRLFIFDVNSLYKHQNTLSGKCFIHEADGVVCNWQNSECSPDGTVDIILDFFCETENGLYERLFEDFSERAYIEEEWKNALNSAGLEIVARLGDMEFEPPSPKEERIYYVTRKVN